VSQSLALEPLGLYVGIGAGQGTLQVNAPNFGDLKPTHSTNKAMLGIRPIPVFGLEVSYSDFGAASAVAGSSPTSAAIKGPAAYALFYLPFPVVTAYAKLGVARLDSVVTTTTSAVCIVAGCNVFRVARNDTHAAVGAGAQVKLGAWAIRGEYERFRAAGGDPSLVSLNLSWTFF
jgi:hypothetical protein